MGPFFTTNDSDISQLEGLYVKERNPPATIKGANLSATVVVGEAIRGPRDKAVLISSEARFIEVFGGRDQGSGGSSISPMWQALMNKPFGALQCVRAVAANAAKASATVYGAKSATGTIQCVTKAEHVDAETVVIGDGVVSKTFEFDVAGDGVGGSNIQVNISGATTAADCAVILAAAINNSVLTIEATHAGSGLLNLVNLTAGTAGNVAITDTVTDTDFTHSGMSGGTASGSALATLYASSEGQWGNNMTYAVAAATDGDASHKNLTVSYLGRADVYKNWDISAANGGTDNSLELLGNDDGVLVSITKIASGVPETISATYLSGGTDGSIANSDFTGTGKAMEVANAVKGVGQRFVAERSNSSIKAKIATLASTCVEGEWLMCADAESTSSATVITEAASYRSDRIVYCFNHAYTLDGDTASEVITHPTAWVASILSQTDVDIHPGEEDTKQFTAGITRLYNESYARADYIALRQAGIAAFERDNGVALVSGVTTSLVPGKEEITRRRMTDYLQISLAGALKSSVKKKNTQARRLANAGMCNAFLSDLKQAERIVEQFSVDTEKLNTPTQRAQGIEKILVRVRLIGHMLELVLETEIGTSVTIVEQ